MSKAVNFVLHHGDVMTRRAAIRAYITEREFKWVRDARLDFVKDRKPIPSMVFTRTQYEAVNGLIPEDSLRDAITGALPAYTIQ